ncbi:SHOCT domain-containing protein [Mycetocola sp.]|uniref:SHOCT domain-containing protein n=1 Tax=Mycetocola sp. TaxID=1871042 RepID=UPI003988F1C0
MMWGMGWDMGWSWLFGLLLLAGIVLLVVLAVRVFGGESSRSGGPGATGPASEPSRARQILDERYVRGEMTTEQYREQIHALSENP